MKVKRIAAGFLALLLLLSACSGENGAAGGTADDAFGYAAEMDRDSVMTIDITVDPDTWQSMLDNATAEEMIAVDVTINGLTVENVGLRTKGNSSLSAVARDENSDRYSFKLDFDEYVKDQSWLGLDKLNLNNNYSDATYMKEYLSYDIMRSIGVETALYCYADISVNGERWGLYLAIEDYDGSFNDRAQNGEGELYKPESMDMNMGERENMPDMENGGFAPPEGMENFQWQEGEGFTPPEDWTVGEGGFERPEDMEGFPGGMGGFGSSGGTDLVYTDDELSRYSAIFDNDKTKTDEDDHRKVVEAIKNLNAGTDLERYVDVDAMLRYLAAHTVVVNLDSYSSSMAHNYILYENDGKITMLPWDYNMALGGMSFGGSGGNGDAASTVVNFPIDTPVSGVSMEDRPMIAKLLEVPEYLERYHQYLQEIVDGYFADGQFEAKVDDINAMIADFVKDDATAFYTYEEYQAAITELKKLGTLRGESIQSQLDGSIPATSEGQTAEPEKLIDASSVDMSALGSMGGMGGFGGERGDRPNRPDMNSATETPPDETGTPPDGAGTPPDETGTPPDGAGAPPDETGTPPDGAGTPPDKTEATNSEATQQ